MSDVIAEYSFDISVILVSFNTCTLTRECLRVVFNECEGMNAEILVVENASQDGSATMIESEFPEVRLIRSAVNLGFGNANNVAMREASGRYIVLLNTDAFLASGALRLAIRHMDEHPRCGVGGARLIGRDGSWQPSSRTFHSLWTDASVMTGLAWRFPKSRFLARLDRTWADQMKPAEVDWVPGAFSILRPEALAQVGMFDPAFFLYYEEVDLCFRIKEGGWQVWYWPDIVVTHVGGESTRSLKTLSLTSASVQVGLWRMRSTLLYYRKHHGGKAWLAKCMEQTLYLASEWRNMLANTASRKERAEYFRMLRGLMDRAWADTKGGRVSPPAPW